MKRTGPATSSSSAFSTDSKVNTRLHALAEAGAGYDAVLSLARDPGVNVNAANHDEDTPLHIASRMGHLEVVRALVDAGADPLRRNRKNRTPGGQLKLKAEIRDCLWEAEEVAKQQKSLKQSELWDSKMKGTQTDNACSTRNL